ncbi:MAG: hypothetical protein HFH86_01300 [Bacilli bacterium]|nr:hypothetical protein [Bacilli bacterium]
MKNWLKVVRVLVCAGLAIFFLIFFMIRNIDKGIELLQRIKSSSQSNILLL